MKKSRKKASETPASHNGIYRLDEISEAFKIPKSVLYGWTVQEKLVTADYPGRSCRPSLYIEKSAAAILVIDMMMRAGILKRDIKKFLDANKQLLYAEKYSDGDTATLYSAFVNREVKIGAIRKYAHTLLVSYVTSAMATKKEEKKNAVQKESRNEGGAVQAHRGEPVEGAAGLASV
jgi:hypothetical protein